METKYKWTDPATGQETAQGVGNPTPITQAPQAPAPISSPQTPQAPQGSVAIDGAKFDTREKQQEAFTNIQPIGNTLYGTPRSPVVPDIISQTDFSNALSSEQSAEMESIANQKIGFNEKQIGELNKANERRVAGTANDIDIKNLTYAESKGWSPSEAKKEEVIEPSTTDKIFNLMESLTRERINAREKAMKDQDLMAKGEAIAVAQTLANKLRTDLQNQGIMDIKEQDVVRSKPILTSQIAGQLNEMSREQKLDTMIMQNNYNNALVELQIAEGNYDRAREIVKETADDAYNMSLDQLNAMIFKNEIEDKAAQRLDQSLQEERALALEGYVHIKSPESLKGLTEDQIYRDPVNGNIYMKPEPTVSRVMEINGVTYGFDDKGNKIVNYGPTVKGGGGGGGTTSDVIIPGIDTTGMSESEIKALQAQVKKFNSEVESELKKLARGGDWGKSWNFIKNQYPGMTNEEVDEALNKWQYNPVEQLQTQQLQTQQQETPEKQTNKITADPSKIDWSKPDIRKQWNDTKKYLGLQ